MYFKWSSRAFIDKINMEREGEREREICIYGRELLGGGEATWFFALCYFVMLLLLSLSAVGEGYKDVVAFTG